MNGARILAGAVAATLVAAVVPGVGLALGNYLAAGHMYDNEIPLLIMITFLGGVPVALLHATLIGLPAYVVLSRRWTIRWWSAAIGGALTGGVPAGLLILGATALGSASLAELAANLRDRWQFAELFAIAGAAGGLTFWWIVRERRPANGARDESDGKAEATS
jgi:hypothetical protein